MGKAIELLDKGENKMRIEVSQLPPVDAPTKLFPLNVYTFGGTEI